MSIQSTINQGLSLAGFLAGQSPQLKAFAETKKANKAIAAYEKQEAKIGPAGSKTEAAAQAELAARAVGAYETKFENNPTAEAAQELAEQKEIAGQWEEVVKEWDEPNKFQRDAAAKALADRQREIAFTNRVIEGIYSADPAFDPRTAAKEAKEAKQNGK